MYKLIIIDDETLVCNELKDIFDWNEIGFEVVGIFYKATDALEFIKANRVDAVITDIKIPLMSGISLVKQCHDEFPDTSFIIISAYKDFEYAKTAIEYNVFRYIVKPISYNELKTAAMELKQHLDGQKNRGNDLGHENTLETQQYFSDYLSGLISSADLTQQRLNSLGLKCEITHSPVAVLKIEITDFQIQIDQKWKYGKDRLYGAINFLLPSEDEYCYFIITNHIYDSIEVIIISKQEDDEFRDKTEAYKASIQEKFKSLLNIDTSVQTTQMKGSLFELDKYVFSDSLISTQTGYIVSLLMNERYSEAIEALNAVYRNFNGDIRLLKLLKKQLYETVISALCIDAEQLSSDIEESSGTARDFLERIITFINEAVALYKSRTAPVKNPLIKKTLQYIDENYSQDITIDDISRHVALSPAYFSVYFKQHTGEKFVDYMIKYRLEKAKELISSNTNLTVSSICEMVGYKSLSHFHRVFKKYTGYTPTEYKDAITNGDLK